MLFLHTKHFSFSSCAGFDRPFNLEVGPSVWPRPASKDSSTCLITVQCFPESSLGLCSRTEWSTSDNWLSFAKIDGCICNSCVIQCSIVKSRVEMPAVCELEYNVGCYKNARTVHGRNYLPAIFHRKVFWLRNHCRECETNECKEKLQVL